MANPHLPPTAGPSFPPNYALRYQAYVSAQHNILTSHFSLTSLNLVLDFNMGGQQAYY